MKKLIAIAALCVGMTAAVFAQDGGWASAWKFGLSVDFKTDVLLATSAKESGKYEVTGNPVEVYEFGNYNKGSVFFFPNNYRNNDEGQRLRMSIQNSGENYDVLAAIRLDGWANKFGSVGDFLLNGDSNDWHVKGTAGIFDGFVGNTGYGGWVGRNGSWSGAWNEVARFGVWRADNVITDVDPKDWGKALGDVTGEYGFGFFKPQFLTSNSFQYYNEWGAAFAVGVTPVEQFKFALGYRLNPSDGGWAAWTGAGENDAKSSRSNINAGFILSGRPLDGVSFDLFYAVKGGDNNTIDPNDGAGKWKNTLGAYIGINLIPNLGLSIGYTGNFNVYESARAKSEAEDNDPASKTLSRKIDSTAPYYSGIDIGVDFSGIDKIGLNFTANISFAGANGTQLDKYYTKYNRRIGFEEMGQSGYVRTGPADISTFKWTDGWFHLAGLVVANLNFIDGVPLTFAVEDRLGVLTSEERYETKGDPNVVSTSSSKWTKNEFHVSLGASYGVGNASVGIGLGLGLESHDLTDTSVAGASATTTTQTWSSSVVTFNIPITFSVSF